MGLAVVHWASSLLYNGLERYEDALTAAQKANKHSDAQVRSMWAPVELVEAAECLYRKAIDRLGRTRVRAELARAHLVYGE